MKPYEVFEIMSGPSRPNIQKKKEVVSVSSLSTRRPGRRDVKVIRHDSDDERKIEVVSRDPIQYKRLHGTDAEFASTLPCYVEKNDNATWKIVEPSKRENGSTKKAIIRNSKRKSENNTQHSLPSKSNNSCSALNSGSSSSLKTIFGPSHVIMPSSQDLLGLVDRTVKPPRDDSRSQNQATSSKSSLLVNYPKKPYNKDKYVENKVNKLQPELESGFKTSSVADNRTNDSYFKCIKNSTCKFSDPWKNLVPDDLKLQIELVKEINLEIEKWRQQQCKSELHENIKSLDVVSKVHETDQSAGGKKIKSFHLLGVEDNNNFYRKTLSSR